jgi:hypothetical protein
MTYSRRTWFDLGTLTLLGGGVVACSFLLVHLGAIVERPRLFALLEACQFVCFGLASIWVIRRHPPSRVALPLIVLVAVAARLILVSSPPLASSDIYRYVWDGRVQAAGINPYRYAPQDPALIDLRDDSIYPGINRKPAHTIYPPVAQFGFFTLFQLDLNNVDRARVALSLIDGALIGLIALALARLGERPERVILYAWHPLAIFEIGSSGHIDVLAALLLLVALHARLSRRPWLAGAGLAAAALVKYYAVVAAPALLEGKWRRDLKLAAGFVATTALAYLPYLGVGWGVLGFLPDYVNEEGFNSGSRFYLLGQLERLGIGLPGALARVGATHIYELLLVVILGLMALWIWLRPCAIDDVPRHALALYLVLLILATPTYPWYGLLVAALLPLAGWRLLPIALLTTGTSLALYLQWWWPGAPRWPLELAYGGGALALGAAMLVSGAAALLRHPAIARVRLGPLSETKGAVQ